MAVLLAFIYAADFIYPEGWTEIQSDLDWELVSENERTQTFQKNIPGADLPAIKVELTTSADPKTLIETAWNVDDYTEIFSSSFIAGSKVDSIFDPDHYTAWEIIDIPFLSPRIYHFQSLRTDSSIHWTQIDPPLNGNADSGLLIPKTNFGSWEVSAPEGKTTFIYRICVDPGGSVPDWIIEQAFQRFCQYTVLDLEKWVLEN